MKKLVKFAFAVVAMACVVFVSASCGKDDEEEKDEQKNSECIITVDGQAETVQYNTEYVLLSKENKDNCVFFYYQSSDGAKYKANQKFIVTKDMDLKSVYGCAITLGSRVVDTVEIGSQYSLPKEDQPLGSGPLMYWQSEDQSVDYEPGQSVDISQNTVFSGVYQMLSLSVDELCDFITQKTKGLSEYFIFDINDYSNDNYLKIQNLYCERINNSDGSWYLNEKELFNNCVFTLVLSTCNIEVVPEAAFAYMPLKYVVLPQSVKKIGQMAFINCGAQSFMLSGSLEVIEPKAFAGNYLLKEITIPESVRIIDQAAFLDCYDLESVTFLGDNITYLGEKNFYDDTKNAYQDITIYVPQGSLETYKKRFPIYANMFKEK